MDYFDQRILLKMKQQMCGCISKRSVDSAGEASHNCKFHVSIVTLGDEPSHALPQYSHMDWCWKNKQEVDT